MNVTAEAKALNLALTKLEKALHDWNLKAATQQLQAAAGLVSGLAGHWKEDRARIEAQLAELQSNLTGTGYPAALEEALRREGLRIEGSFPEYQLPPFRLVVGLGQGEIRLNFGRRNERTCALEPRTVAEWAAKRYAALVKRAFSARLFVRDLETAYQTVNRLHYGGARRKVLWGRAVPLSDIYDALTPRRAHRTDYTLAHFTFDLARLRDAGLEYPPMRFEFGFTRDTRASLLIRDLSGREERFSTLTIHRQEAS